MKYSTTSTNAPMMEAILELRRKRGLFPEERHTAEALALRGRTEAALDALEKAERDRTIYHRWHLVLLHNEIFAGFRNHPRFVALVERIRRDLSRQHDELSRIDLGKRGNANASVDREESHRCVDPTQHVDPRNTVASVHPW